jgi:hypothetical protein
MRRRPARTDATYKLSPQRLIWNLQKLGLVGEIDHYAGVFWWNQRKAVGGKYADANFLRSRLANYGAAIQASVLTQSPSAVFELLWPMDVNDPDMCKLLHYINLPPQWTRRAGSGFDTFICEGFQYGGITHNIEQAQRCAAYPFKELSWDQGHCRYLEGWYYAGWPWFREYLAARRTGVPLIKFWAYDHLCLFGWP